MNQSASQISLARFAEIQKYFYNWTADWLYKNLKEDTSNKPDLPNICILLQALGFKLRELEKKDQKVDEEKDDILKNNSVKVTLECGSSNMKAVLELDEVNCTCQQNANVNDGSLWVVTGTEPTIGNDFNTVEETGSNLLPNLSKEVMQAVREIISRVVKVIDAKGNVSVSEFNVNASSNFLLFNSNNINNNTSSNWLNSKNALFSSHWEINNKQSENIEDLEKSKSKTSLGGLEDKPKLVRQGTYDLINVDEPRSPLLKGIFSPVNPHKIFSSFLSYDVELDELSNYVIRAHRILDCAVKSIKKKTAVQDHVFVTPTVNRLASSNNSFTRHSSPIGSYAGSNTSNCSRISNSSKPSSVCSLPVKTSLKQQQQQKSISNKSFTIKSNSSTIVNSRAFNNSAQKFGSNRIQTGFHNSGSGQQSLNNSLKRSTAGNLSAFSAYKGSPKKSNVSLPNVKKSINKQQRNNQSQSFIKPPTVRTSLVTRFNTKK